MHSSAGGSEEDDRIPRIAPGWDPTSCSLTPAEGFLLSRIDGKTSWRALRSIGGLGPEEVDRYLERWAKEGYLVLGGEDAAGSQEPPVCAAESASGAAASSERPAIDPSLDLSADLQQRILEFEASLERPYHQLLGVDRSADTREIKLAYFRLSKEFHPDRYFRRSIGEYGRRLDRIFKKICEAYELLSDPATREEIERSLAAEPPAEGAYSGGGGATEKIGPEKRTPARPQGEPVPIRIQHLMRLRQRFRVPQKLVLERQFKAKQFYRSAQAAAHQKRWLEAAASMRLAIAFDPSRAEYKEAFAGIQADVHRVRAEALIEQADGSAQADALKLLEEALHFRPWDAALNRRAALLCLDLNDPGRALEYVETLCEVEADDAVSHALLARVLRRKGQRKKAAAALQRAASLDPEHPDVKAERLQLRKR
jgi:curved DNA-binding protein CbpA